MEMLSRIAWGQWETLLAVFRTGTYTQAGGLLHVDATTVSRRIKLLERRIGRQLLFRQEGRLYPTDYCEHLLTYIESASESLRSAEMESAMQDSGTIWRTLRLTAPPFLIKYLLAPAITTLTKKHHIRVELLGTASNISLTRREADIAIRIEDKPSRFNVQAAQIESKQIGTLNYATYCWHKAHSKDLPWAGLLEEVVRTTGSQTMLKLAGPDGFQYQTNYFDTLNEITASGAAKAMLPRLIGDRDKRLKRIKKNVLQQPLWMLSHRQDRDVPHLKTTRLWILDQARKLNTG